MVVCNSYIACAKHSVHPCREHLDCIANAIVATITTTTELGSLARCQWKAQVHAAGATNPVALQRLDVLRPVVELFSGKARGVESRQMRRGVSRGKARQGKTAKQQGKARQSRDTQQGSATLTSSKPSTRSSASAVILKNHCFSSFCSTLAPERHEVPSAATCSLARTVRSTGSQLTAASD